jgi:hypothetical protein
MGSITDDPHVIADAFDKVRAAVKIIRADSDDRIVLMFPGSRRLNAAQMKELRNVIDFTFPPAIANRVVILDAAVLAGAEPVDPEAR